MGSIRDVSCYANVQRASAEAGAVQLKSGSCRRLQPAALCRGLAQRQGVRASSALRGDKEPAARGAWLEV